MNAKARPPAAEADRGSAEQTAGEGVVTSLAAASRPSRHVTRRRVTRQLDRLLGVEHPTVDLTAISLDYWHEIGMDLGVQQREWRAAS